MLIYEISGQVQFAPIAFPVYFHHNTERLFLYQNRKRTVRRLQM